MAEVNRSYFNEEASTYDSKHGKLNERLTEEIQARLDWIGVDWANADSDDDSSGTEDKARPDENADGAKKSHKPGQSKREVRLLDYACGTGMMTRALAPYTTQCVGIDISEGMVAAYNARAEYQGLSHDEMHAIVGDLAAPEGPQPPDLLSSSPQLAAPFDVAAIGGGLHHMADPDLAAERVARRLRPGAGVLLVWDFAPHEPRGPHARGSHAVLHHGLSEDRVRAMFERAGVADGFEIVVLGSGVSVGGGHGHDDGEPVRRQIFLARGQRSA
ncbi:S-adenosyl-L-methionine-dependent methyltransferase [Hypoxylon sp. FL1284]|nr:S-adenosyl-L-methionine-dependent methyltransferase [Hypoxylon sp. FL1284]